MGIVRTGVTFRTEEKLLQMLYDAAESKLKNNLKDFCGRKVLVEGGGYQKIWLETQPMGGEMYAKRDLTAAANNQLLFMEHQRRDGRIPGSIMVEDGRVIPQFNKFQGFCFPDPAFNLYYWLGEDRIYLEKLYHSLKGFDGYLWRVRDSDGDGCLESWCVCDTGEDHALRYGDAPFWWEEAIPPAESAVVPIASMDVMSFSFSARHVLAKISAVLKNGESDYWEEKALEVRRKIQDCLWDDKKGACFDRDKTGAVMPSLIHNNLRCMYWGAFSQEMADRFVQEHLLNPQEFWTPMPLPSVAADDPLFRNNPGNDWSGQPEGLTYQRALRALENYGYQRLLAPLAGKLFRAVGEPCVFTQQFDPFAGKPSGGKDGYGPTMLAVLEYISRLYGVHLEGKEIWWGALGGARSEYTQTWGERAYTIRCDGTRSVGLYCGRQAFDVETGVRVVTDYDGVVKSTVKLV